MTLKRFGRVAALILAALILLAVWSNVLARTANAPAYTSYASNDFFFPPYSSDSDRMGIGGAIGLYNPALRAGWYTDWSANVNPPHPGGMEYARLISFRVDTNDCGFYKIPASQRSQVVESITGTVLIENLRANPSALWLVGNEPDSIYNCSPIMPELYAELYHEFYTFIKTYDPSARVAIGAIVQPSPLRLAYLDKVLNRYQALYGEKLPTALWNIHLYAFREVAGDTGAGVPPGASSNIGWTYSWAQTVNIGVLAQNLRAMRQWMADRGERNKPLIVTEFGQVVPDDGSYTLDGLTFTPEVSRDYLQGSINHFLTATDPQIGYPADGNRLIQLWAWYSLHDMPHYGGDLVNLDGTLTLAGTAFAQIASQRFTPYADLYPVPLALSSLPTGGTVAISTSAAIQLGNRGNVPAQSAPVHFAQYDYASGQLVASDVVTVSQAPARYEGALPQVSAEWVWTPEKMYTLTFEIDPGQTISQARRSNQQLSYLAGYDLAVAALTSDLYPVFYWDRPITTTITATIRNLGNTPSPTGTVQLSASILRGTAYWDQIVMVPALASNASVDITSAFVLPSPGGHVITATAQCANPDLDERNNTARLSLLAATHQVRLPLVLRTTP